MTSITKIDVLLQKSAFRDNIGVLLTLLAGVAVTMTLVIYSLPDGHLQKIFGMTVSQELSQDVSEESSR